MIVRPWFRPSMSMVCFRRIAIFCEHLEPNLIYHAIRSFIFNHRRSTNKNEKQVKRKWRKILPCRPTISATCSELGTGTHSVMFCDFFDRSSRLGNIVVNALNPILFVKTLFNPFTSFGLSDEGDLLLSLRKRQKNDIRNNDIKLKRLLFW